MQQQKLKLVATHNRCRCLLSFTLSKKNQTGASVLKGQSKDVVDLTTDSNRRVINPLQFQRFNPFGHVGKVGGSQEVFDDNNNNKKNQQLLRLCVCTQ